MKLKLVLTDVDGVLTDGGRYYSEKGEEFRKFHTRDGMGINILLRNGIKTAIVTKEKSDIIKKWANDMNVSKVYQNAIHKETLLKKICREFRVKDDEIAYIGDDINDIDLLKKVGFSVAPQDAHYFVKEIVDYTCTMSSGRGVFRELADLILSVKFPNNKKWY